MILSGILTSIGGYGLFRIALPICPIAAEHLAWVIGLLGVINIVYGALVALAQTELRRLIAYTAISQMGFVLLGLSAWTSPDAAQYWSWGMKGAAFQLIVQGLTTAGLFFMAGLLRERLGHLDISQAGGIARAMPVYSGLAMVFFFTAMGLPLLGGFVGPFCTLLGCWNFRPESWHAAGQVFTLIAAGSLVLSAGCLIWTLQRVLLGPRSAPTSCDDLDGREGFVAGSLAVLLVALGVWPMLVFDWLEPTVTGLVQTLAQVTAG
jgi:NADH-quinone oxidoreductase subunit M